jgi:hypothetical protein
MAHVFEMTDRPEAGENWLADHAEGWANDTVVATHCWWHRGLFQLALGRPERALDIYHHHVRAGDSEEVADLIDASALLWRIDLAGCDTGGRWLELADAWAPHIDDGFCSFTDLHAMLAFVGARDWRRADLLVRALRALTRGRPATARRRACSDWPRAARWPRSAAATTCSRSRCSPACRRRRTGSAAATRSATSST